MLRKLVILLDWEEPYIVQCDILDTKGRLGGGMAGGKERVLDHQILGAFDKSILKRYEQWKRKDLLATALAIMPKQVKTENVIDNLIGLKAEFTGRLTDEG